MATTQTESIHTIDGHYHYPGRAAAYLIVDGDEAAFVDTVTRFSVPYLLESLKKAGLSPEQVRYIIVTHVHLDHSGGAAELLKHCPNATIVAHPRAGRHIIDPSRLVESARPIYGDEAFDRLYGEIEPVDAARVVTKEDGEMLQLGERTLTFYDSPGHARHHFVVQDSATNSIISGDAFGLCYTYLQRGDQPYFSYVCAPPQFDPAAARSTIERIRDLEPDRVFVTHFGQSPGVQQGAEQLLHDLDAFDAAVNTAAQTDLVEAELLDYCTSRALDITKQGLVRAGLDLEDDEVMKWALSEHSVTSQGLAALAQKRRDAAKA